MLGVSRFAPLGIGHNSSLYDSQFADHDSRALGAPMHLDFANLLNLVSTITLIGALVFTGLQVRAANRARREQAAVTVIETAALSENSARFLELLSEIPEGASAAVIENLDADTRRQIFLFGLRVEVIGTWFFTVWWMFKPLTILPAARSSVSGRARKAGRKKGGSARGTMNFWNGANG
jgi:hypothetical protein